MLRRLPRSKATQLIIKDSQVYPMTYLRRAGAENTSVVAVGSIGKEVEELVDWCVGAILQLGFKGKDKTAEKRMYKTELIINKPLRR